MKTKKESLLSMRSRLLPIANELIEIEKEFIININHWNIESYCKEKGILDDGDICFITSTIIQNRKQCPCILFCNEYIINLDYTKAYNLLAKYYNMNN